MNINLGQRIHLHILNKGNQHRVDQHRIIIGNILAGRGGLFAQSLTTPVENFDKAQVQKRTHSGNTLRWLIEIPHHQARQRRRRDNIKSLSEDLLISRGSFGRRYPVNGDKNHIEMPKPDNASTQPPCGIRGQVLSKRVGSSG